MQYHFVDDASFDELVHGDGLLEWFPVFGHRYGTPRAPVQQHLGAGDDVVLELDTEGALAVKQQFPQAVLVFVRPPSRDEQRRRLVDRGLDDPDEIERRLAAAAAEEAAADRFDAIVVNDDVDTAVAQVAGILGARRAEG